MEDLQTLLDAYLEETAHEQYYELRPGNFEAGRRVLDLPPEMQIAVVHHLMALIEQLHSANWESSMRLDKLRGQLFARHLPYTPQDIERLLQALEHVVTTSFNDSLSFIILRHVARYRQKQELTPGMRASLESCRETAMRSHWMRKVKEPLDELLGASIVGEPDAGEAWADVVRSELAAMEPELHLMWATLFTHAATADGGKPSAKWLKEAEKNLQAVGEEEFRRHIIRWMSLAAPPAPFETVAPKPPDPDEMRANRRLYDDYQQAQRDYYAAVREYLGHISEKNIAILKGLAWYCAPLADAELARALGHLTEAGYGSVRERGAWAKSAGNAAIWALGQMPNAVGVGPLAHLRTRLRDRSALKLIAAAIESAAQSAGMTVDELEDLAVPTGGLSADGVCEETFGADGAVRLTLDAKNAKTKCQWYGEDGQPRKAVPKNVKTKYSTEVKALKAAEAEIQQALSAQSARFDRFLLEERTWNYGVWRERYLSHPVLGNLARRLIWTVDGIPALPDDLPEGLPDTAEVRLWHPLGEAPEDVLGWRQMLETRGIVQPFKQAHREVYLLTDAERNTRTYSNRFAAHILKQHQFNSLCVLRGWKNSLRLMVDDEYPPARRELPRWNLRAEFWVEGIGEDYGTDTNEAGTYLRVVTDQVRFYPLNAAVNAAHAGGGGYHGVGWRQGPTEALPLEDIPPLAFSEIMRDVDLFVGVASVGNDPTWADGGPEGRYVDYWQSYAFGDLTETAQTRAAVLARLLPRLKIADRCQLDGKFLVVKGDLRTYKIHLGSGNILMEPNDQYLCIVPSSRAAEGEGDLFLPFEGDRVLAVVLSKAFLLAADRKITDPTITRQIGGKLTA